MFALKAQKHNLSNHKHNKWGMVSQYFDFNVPSTAQDRSRTHMGSVPINMCMKCITTCLMHLVLGNYSYDDLHINMSKLL